jgi:hypothetical protein
MLRNKMKKINKVTIQNILDNPELINHDGFYSFDKWWCNESSLRDKAEILMAKVKILVEAGVIDPEKTILRFENVNPDPGILYDVICFNNMHNVYLGGVVPSCGHEVSEGESSFRIGMKETSFLNWRLFLDYAKKTNLKIC